MDRNFSLTKGCFVHKSSGKRKKPGKIKELPHYAQYKRLLETMEGKIQDIEENAYKETFDGLVKFTKQCHSTRIEGIKEIPAAILVMGVNMPDHSNIFRLLQSELHSNGIPATVVLQSRECANLFNLMQKLVSGIIDRYQMEQGLESIPLKKMDYTFSKLLSYYDSLPGSEVKATPRKSPSRKQKIIVPDYKSSPIVLCIQDVEAFNIEVLQQLILSCNLYIEKLPIVLVFGMASAMVTLHNILPQKALSCLGIETFYSMTAIEYLTKIVHEVILDPGNPFKLGPKVFRLIVDTVLYHDFSVTNLTHLLKFCLLEHFYNNKITALCCCPSEIDASLRVLQKDDFDAFKNLPSLARYVENNNLDCKTKLKSEEEFKSLLKDSLEKHHEYYSWMIALLKMLHTLTKDLPDFPFGKHLREIYPFALEGNITSLYRYALVEKLLKMQSREELKSKLSSCLSIMNQSLEVNRNPQLLEVNNTIMKQLEKLKNLKEADYEKQSALPFESMSEKIMSRSQLQEKLRLQLQAQRSKFDQCRDSIVKELTSIFKTLHPPSQLPLYEIFYFDNVSAVKRHLMAVPRVTLHKNLMNPQAHLKCQCCSITESTQITPFMPDICSLYKLHLECGKLINLHDWLEAFKSLKVSNSEEKEDRQLNAEQDIQLNIRFMHTVSELQLMGFIKSTKRKTDHVARLTFGNF